MLNKKGSALRIISAILGGILFLIALYFLNKEQLMQATVIGVIGVLLITVSLFPFLRSTRAR
jgi:predicted membrane-bound mannosyltransferase